MSRSPDATAHPAPRVAGPRDLIITGFDHVGSIPARWDLGGTLPDWSGGGADQLNVTALRALRAGYAEERSVPQPLDLGIFSAVVCASMNWLVSRVGSRSILKKTPGHARSQLAPCQPSS